MTPGSDPDRLTDLGRGGVEGDVARPPRRRLHRRLPPAPWQAAQFAIYAARPASKWNVVASTWTPGIGGPLPNEAT